MGFETKIDGLIALVVATTAPSTARRQLSSSGGFRSSNPKLVAIRRSSP
jgi:hypothetical protein